MVPDIQRIPRPLNERFQEAVFHGHVKVISGDVYLLAFGYVFPIGKRYGHGIVLSLIGQPWNAKKYEDKLTALCKEAGLPLVQKHLDSQWKYLTYKRNDFEDKLYRASLFVKPNKNFCRV